MHVAITGASSGIGHALASACAAAGHSLTLIARREALLRELADGLDVPCGVVPCDLTDPTARLAWIEEACAARGPIEWLINNAGIQLVGPVAEADPEAVARLYELNLRAPVALSAALLPGMLARGAGAIVNVSSLVAVTPLPDMADYNASKAALATWSEDLRRELRGSGVHVLTVYPGPVETPMAAKARTLLADTFSARNAPIGRPDALARLILRGVARRRASLVYPRLYAPARWFPNTAAWVSRLLAPRHRGAEE